MVKRGSQSPSKRGNAAKVAKVSTPPAEDPFVEKCAPVLEAIAAAEGLSTPVKDMLQNAATICLKTSTSDRHAYERSVVEMIETGLGAELARRRQVVAEAEKELADAKTEHEGIVAKLETQNATTERFQATKDQKEQAYDEAVKLLAEAVAGVSAAKASADAITEERDVVQSEKDGYEKVLNEVWVPLKDHTLKGNDRKKGLAQLMRRLPKDSSLTTAIELALKSPPETRRPFCNLALENGEAELKKRVGELNANIGSFEAELVQKNGAVSEAEGKAEAAKTVKTVALNEVIAAENAWVDENTKSFEMQTAIDDWPSKSTNLADILSDANGDLSDFQDKLSKFEAMRDGVADLAEGHIFFQSPAESQAESVAPLYPSPTEEP